MKDDPREKAQGKQAPGGTGFQQCICLHQQVKMAETAVAPSMNDGNLNTMFGGCGMTMTENRDSMVYHTVHHVVYAARHT